MPQTTFKPEPGLSYSAGIAFLLTGAKVMPRLLLVLQGGGED